MSSRPFVTVYDGITGEAEKTPIQLPAVFSAPIRGDVIHFVFRNQNKNKRQPHGVSPEAGKQHSAISWGTGRAVARIPRIGGSGSNRNGQGAFGNMCRKGHMFSPLKTWRRWQIKTPKNMRRYAVASAIAATAVPSIVTSRGHHISGVEQIPLVINSKCLNVIRKTRQAVYLLKKINAYTDVLKVIASKKARAGKGKMRGKHYKVRKGPMVIYGENDCKEALKAFANIPGIDVCNVKKLSVLNLCPGGQLGRFCIWTEDAFKMLNDLFGTFTEPAKLKKGFKLSSGQMASPDITRVMKELEKTDILRAKITPEPVQKRKNPLRNYAAMVKLNPYAAIAKKHFEEERAKLAEKKKQSAETKAKIIEQYKNAEKEAAAKRAKKEKVPNDLVKAVTDGKKTKEIKTMKKIFNKKINF